MLATDAGDGHRVNVNNTISNDQFKRLIANLKSSGAAEPEPVSAPEPEPQPHRRHARLGQVCCAHPQHTKE